MEHFAGLGVSVKETNVCIVDDTGRIVREVEMVWSVPEALLQVLTNPAYRFKRVGPEAGPLSQWLFSALAEAGLPVICIETRHMRAVLKAQINKTDRNDARGIAQMMRAGLHEPVSDIDTVLVDSLKAPPTPNSRLEKRTCDQPEWQAPPSALSRMRIRSCSNRSAGKNDCYARESTRTVARHRAGKDAALRHRLLRHPCGRSGACLRRGAGLTETFGPRPRPLLRRAAPSRCSRTCASSMARAPRCRRRPMCWSGATSSSASPRSRSRSTAGPTRDHRRRRTHADARPDRRSLARDAGPGDSGTVVR